MPKNLVVQGKVQLEHISHIVKVHVEATSLAEYNPWWKKPNWQAHYELFHRNPDILVRDHLIQINYKEKHTHASFKTARTCENFKN